MEEGCITRAEAWRKRCVRDGADGLRGGLEERASLYLGLWVLGTRL